MNAFIKSSLLCPILCLSNFALAKPVGSHTTPEREKARCESGVDLCDNVARDDLNNCNSAGQSHCSDNYYEDINQCTQDYNDCLDAIAIKGSASGILQVPGAAMQQLQAN